MAGRKHGWRRITLDYRIPILIGVILVLALVVITPEDVVGCCYHYGCSFWSPPLSAKDNCSHLGCASPMCRNSGCCEDAGGTPHPECCYHDTICTLTTITISTTTLPPIPQCWENAMLYDGYPLYRDATPNTGKPDKSSDVNDDHTYPYGCDPLNIYGGGVGADKVGGTGILQDRVKDYDDPSPTRPTIILSDSVKDRYWEITPTDYNPAWMSHVDGTRPGYGWDFEDVDDELHTTDFDYGSSYLGDLSGLAGGAGYGVINCDQVELPGCENPRDHYCRPKSLQHQPCEACRRHNTCPALCFNYDLRYYRMFNINTVWANIFKISPEVNMPVTGEHYIRVEDESFIDSVYEVQCVPPTGPALQDDGTYLLGIAEGPCREDSDCNSRYCSIDSDKKNFGHCCPRGTEYDLTRECCMANGVNDAKRTDQDYCKKKIARWGVKCIFEEGHCKDDSECMTGYKCLDNIYTNLNDSACCPDISDQLMGQCPESEAGYLWDGKTCTKVTAPGTATDITKFPWMKSWTRTAEAEPGDGGGPISIYMAGGGMIPDWWEAACRTDPNIVRDRSPGGKKYPDPCPECKDCMYAWPYIENPSPIWAETRNIGNSYTSDSTHKYCGNGAWCYSGQEAYCVVKGWADPVTAKPKSDKNRKCGCRHGNNCKDACADYDCNCYRDLDQPNGMTPDPYVSGHITSCEKGPPLAEYGCCGATDYWPGNQDSDCWTPKCSKCPKGQRPPNCKGGYDDHDSYVEPGIVDVNTDLIPQSCGALKMKQVDYYPYPVNKDPVTDPSEKAPESWFTYSINPNPCNAITNPRDRPEHENDLPQPTDPWTVLNYEILGTEICTRAKSLEVTTTFTIRNYMNRRAYVEQCMWHGCSRLEVDSWFIRHGYKTCRKVGGEDDGKIYNVNLGGVYKNTCIRPCCCWRQNNKCDANNQECLCSGEYCGSDEEIWCEMYDECYCHEHCWGCWHHRGLDDYYPATYDRNDDNARMPPEKGPDYEGPAYPEECQRDECIAYEEMEDISVVTAEPYGSHLEIARPLTVQAPHVDVKVYGEIRYKTPEKAASDDYTINYTRAIGYLTIQALDDEYIDLLNGFELDVPERTRLAFTKSNLPLIHELTGLESAMRWDYDLIPKGSGHRLAEFHGFIRGDSYDEKKCVKDTTKINTWGFLGFGGESTAQDPVYYIGNYNPHREYLLYYDQFNALTSTYTWARDVLAVDKADPECIYFIQDWWYNLRLYRNYRYDEKRTWDFEAITMHPRPSEEFGRHFLNQPHAVMNVEQEESCVGCQFKVAFVKYAPYCDHQQISEEEKNKCNDETSTRTVLPSGGVVCKWKDGWPISEDKCRDVVDPTVSKLDFLNCEKSPSRYKSYCENGIYKAYWWDTFQVKYYWQNNKCVVETIKECQPKDIQPQSYTLIFDSGEIDPMDIDNATLTIHTNMRNVKLQPFMSDPQEKECEDDVDCSKGGVQCFVKKVHELKPKPEVTSSGTKIKVKIKAEDLCDGTEYG
ncbi:MAG: hypothetical protein ABIH11_02985 [Candidatus Altiarchaeota archaeon]